jgi:hypothetical protein
MESTPAYDRVEQFRGEAYRTLGHRKDSLFELLEAAVVGGPQPLVRLSLEAVFRRGWASTSDALNDGRLSVERIRRLVGRTEVAGAAGRGWEREVWALDGTHWPRPGAATSPGRTWGYQPQPGLPQKHLVGGWEYQWLVRVPERGGSWMLPLDVQRRGVGAGRSTELAIRQVRAALRQRPAGAPRPVVTCDSQYEPVRLVRARLAADLLVRLARRRRVYRRPPPYPGRGRRDRKHGAVLKLTDPTTHGQPDRTQLGQDPTHGTVRVAVWEQVHVQSAAEAPFTLIRVTVEHLPRHARAPDPLWLAWIGGPLPDDLLALWRWYGGRFTIEHGFRFAKQALGWTTIRPRAAEAADRWTWLLVLGYWELWVARAVVADQRLPWERPAPPERLSPGRVRRALPALLARLGSPARAPRRRGVSPGRRPGDRPRPRPHYPIARRRPKRAA